MLDVSPGKEEEFRYIRRFLAASARLDRLIEATERPGQSSVSSWQRDRGRDAVWDRIYVSEKLRELERQRLAGRPLMAGRERNAGAATPAARAARASRGLRAGFAARLARLALALHREAAAEAGLQPETERPR